MKMTIVATVAYAALCAGAYDLPPCTVPMNLGVQMKTDTFNEATLREVRGLGFRVVRRGLYWNAVEKEKGVYDFSSVDAQMKVCKELGLTVIVTLFSSNSLYEEPRGGVQTEAGRKGFAAFAVAATKHFSGQDVMFEIWNEPNVRTFWRKDGTHNSPEFAKEYSDLVNTVVPAMVKAVPGVFVMAGSVSNYWEPSYQWTEECFKNGVLKSGIRAWSVHPYGVKTPEEFKVGHDRTKELLKKYGAPDMPLIDSERGFTNVKNGVNDEGWSGGSSAKLMDYQAWHLVRQYLVDMIEGVRLTSWYEYKGNEGFSLYENGKPRPALEAFKVMVRELDGYSFKSLVKTDSPQDRIAIFANGSGARKLVAWTSAKPGGSPDETMEHAVVVRTKGSDSLSGTGMLGDAAKVPQGLGLWLTGAPQYVAIPDGVELVESASVGRAVFPVVPGGAAGGTPAVVEGKALDLCSAESGWKFIPNTGKGAVSVGKSSDGKDAVFIDWDFSQSKSKSTPYVMTSVPLNGVDGAGSIDFLAKSSLAQNLTVRVIDSTGQTLQFRCRIKGTGAWEKMTFPLGRKLEHWDGANDGFAHFPLKTFNVNVPKPGEAVSGRVELCDFATTAGKTAAGGATSASAAPSAPSAAPKQAPAPKAGKPPKVDALAEAIDLKLFDGSAKWDFIKNTGKGSFELKDVEGVKAGAVNWDFSASKAKSVPYVLATVPVEIAGGQAITFQACSTVPQKLTFRVTDATGQTLQFKTKIQGNGEWETIKFPLGKKLEHWGGDNDGFTHFPVKNFCVSIPKPADCDLGTTLFTNVSVK